MPYNERKIVRAELSSGLRGKKPLPGEKNRRLGEKKLTGISSYEKRFFL